MIRICVPGGCSMVWYGFEACENNIYLPINQAFRETVVTCC